MKIAFLFSGQGAQFPGMYKDLYDNYKEVADAMNKADKDLGRKITEICFYGSRNEINLTHNTQPCVLATELAAADLLVAHGVKPDVVAGFSLGEYAALAVAEVISREDIFKIIQFRADVMQDAVPIGKGGMVAVLGADWVWVERVCKEIGEDKIAVANYNSPQQIALAGTKEGVGEFIERAKEKKIKALRLPVSVPSHCSLMRNAAKELGNRLHECSFHNPRIPVYMNYTGEKLETIEKVGELLELQLFNAVQWVRTLNNMKLSGIDTYIECGPGEVLSGLVKNTLQDVKILHVDDVISFQKTLQELSE